MNANESIASLRQLADMWAEAANHPSYYNSDVSHHLAMVAQTLYQESANLSYINERYGLPQLEQI